MRLFIAEKPSVAKAVLAELGGTPTRGEGHYRVGSDVVTWCFGHMLEMAMPEDYSPAWREWRLEDLPLRPSSWKLVPRAEAKKQLGEIGKLLKQATEVVHAGDPDREGQLLVDEVLQHFGYRGPVRRFWVSAQDSVSIQRGLKALRANQEFAGLSMAALGRGRADWLVGLNLTRACTLASGGSMRTVGRVQTPTLALVVARDRAIASFRPAPYYSVVVELEHPAGRFQAKWTPGKDQPGLDAEGRVVDPAVASAVVAKALGQEGLLVEHKEEAKSEAQPKAFTLTKLTLEASRRWGYGADDVLSTAQALYETHKLTSYPRTDCAYLPEVQHADASRVLASLKQMNPHMAPLLDRADPRIKSPTWNDRKVTAHHGIIPTMHVGDVTKLSEMEANIYELVVRSYVAQFYGPHQYLHTSATAQIVDERFAASGKVVTDAGWRAVLAQPAEQDQDDAEAERQAQALPPMKQGDHVTCRRADRKDLKTKPPPRFTEGTLQVAMENVHQVVTDPEERRILKEEDGIGTPATRATIISELKRRGFLRRSGKHLVSTEDGQLLVDGLPPEIKSASLTAFFERGLKDIALGSENLDAFLAVQQDFVTRLVGQVKSAAPARSIIQCPVCSTGELRRIPRKAGKGKSKGHFWGCSRFKDGCQAAFDDVDGHPRLDAVPNGPQDQPTIECPTCGKGTLSRIPRKDGSGHFWGCSRFKEGCKATFQDASGKPQLEPHPAAPAARTSTPASRASAELTCPTCGKGALSRIPRKDGSGHFWGCSRFKEGCKATFQDAGGKPQLAPHPAAPSARTSTPASASAELMCPTCGKGTLSRIPRKDGSGHFWGCSRFKEGCKATFQDAGGKPQLAKK